MVKSVRAELGKLRTVKSTFVLIGIGFVLTIGFGLLIAYRPGGGIRGHRASGLPIPPHGSAKWFLQSFSVFGMVALPFALVIGVLVVTSEYRHKTVTSTFLAEPRRTLVVGSKLIVSLLAGLAAGVSAAAGALVLGLVMVATSHGTVSTMLGQYEQLLGYLGAAALYAVYGAGLGALFKNQIFALVTGLVVDILVLPILTGVVPSAARWFPGEAAQALASAVQRSGITSTNVNLLPWWGGVGILLAWGIVLAGLGAATAVRTDVT